MQWFLKLNSLQLNYMNMTAQYRSRRQSTITELDQWTGLVDWTSGLINIVRKPLLGINSDNVRVLTGLDLNETVMFL